MSLQVITKLRQPWHRSMCWHVCQSASRATVLIKILFCLQARPNLHSILTSRFKAIECILNKVCPGCDATQRMQRYRFSSSLPRWRGGVEKDRNHLPSTKEVSSTNTEWKHRCITLPSLWRQFPDRLSHDSRMFTEVGCLSRFNLMFFFVGPTNLESSVVWKLHRSHSCRRRSSTAQLYHPEQIRQKQLRSGCPDIQGKSTAYVVLSCHPWRL